MTYTHPLNRPTGNSERDGMPYIQIETHTWIVMREPKTHPVAIIEHVPAVAGIPKSLLRRWDANPGRRPLISMHDSLEDANRAYKWDRSQNLTGREDYVWPGGPADKSPERLNQAPQTRRRTQ